MTTAHFISDDALHAIKALRDKSLSCVVTSPPYFGRRRYTEDDREIGKDSLDEYVADVCHPIMALVPKLAPGGTVWLNLGDSATGSGGAGGDYLKGGSKDGRPVYRQGKTGDLPLQSYCMAPERIIMTLQRGGWMVRARIIWNKDRVRPEDPKHVKRPLEQHEMIYMLSRDMTYRWNDEYHRNMGLGDVWTFPPALKSRGETVGHAPFPVELPLRCLSLTGQPGEWVLDPFCGGGATLVAAELLGMNAVGIDLDPGMGNLIENRLLTSAFTRI